MSEAPDEIFSALKAIAATDTPGDAINSHDARLILDLVSNLRKPEQVLSQHGVTPQEFAAKAQSPIFAMAFKEAQKVWKSDMNIEQRIRMKSAFLLEDSLMTLFNIIRQEGIGVNAKLAAIEQLTKISTVANVPKAGTAVEKHNIVINIGGDAPPISITTETKNGNDTLTAG